jgi:hypothetical protein
LQANVLSYAPHQLGALSLFCLGEPILGQFRRIVTLVQAPLRNVFVHGHWLSSTK